MVKTNEVEVISDELYTFMYINRFQNNNVKAIQFQNNGVTVDGLQVSTGLTTINVVAISQVLGNKFLD